MKEGEEGEKGSHPWFHCLQNFFLYICLGFFSMHIYFIKFGIILLVLSYNLLFQSSQIFPCVEMSFLNTVLMAE